MGKHLRKAVRVSAAVTAAVAVTAVVAVAISIHRIREGTSDEAYAASLDVITYAESQHLIGLLSFAKTKEGLHSCVPGFIGTGLYEMCRGHVGADYTAVISGKGFNAVYDSHGYPGVLAGVSSAYSQAYLSYKELTVTIDAVSCRVGAFLRWKADGNMYRNAITLEPNLFASPNDIRRFVDNGEFTGVGMSESVVEGFRSSGTECVSIRERR